MLRTLLAAAVLTHAALVLEGQSCVYATDFDGALAAPTPVSLDKLGSSVAIDGEVAVVGASCGDAAYLYEQVPGGGWTSGSPLVPVTPLSSPARFGEAVAIDGDLIAVGAPDDRTSGPLPSGSVYLFERDPNVSGGWRELTRLFPDDASNGDEFGASVSLSGDTLVVGAPKKLVSIHRTGAVYVFERDAGGPNAWGQTRRLRANSPIANSFFGNAVAVEGDRLVIGSEGDESFFVFERSTIDPEDWIQRNRFTLTLAGSLGDSVALSGDTIAVGDSSGGPAADGYVLVYERRPGPFSQWNVAARLSTVPVQPNAGFGTSVAIDGDVILVGATRLDNFVGGAFLYERNEGGTEAWGEIARFDGQDPGTNDGMGAAVALDEDRLIVGIPRDDPLGALDSGSAETYSFEFLGPRSVVQDRNAGANPVSYTASTAVLGGALRGTCDLTTTGHDLAVFFAFDAPANVVLAGGQVLLCVEQARDGELFTGRGITLAGPMPSFSFPIPNDNSVCGTRLCTQVLHVAGTFPFALSNAQDVTVGL